MVQQLAEHQRAVAAGAEGEVDAPVPLAHLPREPSHHDLGRRTGETEPHLPAVAALRRRDLGASALPHPQDHRRRFQQRPPGRGQPDAPRRPVEQRGTQIGLEGPDGSADVGLGEMQALGRAAEVQFLGDHEEHFELGLVHVGIISIFEIIMTVLVLDRNQKRSENRSHEQQGQ